jgi:rhodanese-related sulfurtransferase
MGRGIALVVAAFLLSAALPAAAVDPGISQGQLMDGLTNGHAPPVIDVRTPGEYRAGHVPGAINIPLQEFEQRFGELSAYQDKEVVLYCESGMRASHGARWLESKGFEDLRFLDGHMSAWREAGLPTER